MFDNLDDPKQQALLAMALGLLGGQGGKGFGGFARDLGQAGLLGLNRYTVADESKRRNALTAGQAEMQKMQLGGMQRQQADQEFAAQLAPQYFSPGNAPSDGMGPVLPPRQDFAGFGSALASRNPTMAMPFIQAGIKDDAPLVMKPGDVAFDKGTGKVKYAAPDKDKFQAGDTREIKSGQRVITQEFNGKEWKTVGTASLWKPDAPEKGPAPPQGYRFTPEGNLQPIPGGPADAPKEKSSDAERIASGYASRMQAAEKLMSALPAGEQKPGLREAALVAAGQETLANALPALAGGRSEQRQLARQAQEDWVRAKLRKESGAVIGENEMDREIRVYFPQIGDSEKVIKQKEASRRVAIQAMLTGAGRAAPKDDSGGFRVLGKE